MRIRAAKAMSKAVVWKILAKGQISRRCFSSSSAAECRLDLLTGTLAVRGADKIALIELNRPSRKNAIGVTLLEQLENALAEMDQNKRYVQARILLEQRWSLSGAAFKTCFRREPT